MGRVCAFVVFFLVLLSLAETVTGALPPWAAGFLELTNGILRLSPTRSGFVTAAALLGWGGLSVHGQTASVLEGTGRFTVGGEVFVLTEGETLVMPKDVPHAVYGQERFKMLLVVF